MTTQNQQVREDRSGRVGVPDALIGYHRMLACPTDAPRLALLSEELIEVLSSMGANAAVDHLARLTPLDFDEDELASGWTKLFVRGAVPPYETSHMAPSMAGHLGELADLAGFYKAFGLEVQGERSDHLLAELEFLTFASFKYLEALGASNAEAAEVCANTMADFLEEHFGSWIGVFAQKVAKDLPRSPYEPVLSSLAAFVSWLCAETGITPRPLGTAGPGFPLESLLGDEAEPAGCLGCPLPGERELDIPI